MDQPGSLAWAAGTLRRHGMPPEEIGTVIAAEDPQAVRRHLELHRERLEERLTEQRRTLAVIERFLAAATRKRTQHRREG